MAVNTYALQEPMQHGNGQNLKKVHMEPHAQMVPAKQQKHKNAAFAKILLNNTQWIKREQDQVAPIYSWLAEQ